MSTWFIDDQKPIAMIELILFCRKIIKIWSHPTIRRTNELQKSLVFITIMSTCHQNGISEHFFIFESCNVLKILYQTMINMRAVRLLGFENILCNMYLALKFLKNYYIKFSSNHCYRNKRNHWLSGPSLPHL